MKLRLHESILTFLLILVFVGVTSAQSGAISGNLTDNGGEALIGANVVLTNTNTAKVYGTVTDFDGNFTVGNLPYGSYDMNVSYIGFSDYDTSFELNQPNMMMNTMTMSEGGIDIEGIVVTGVMDIVQDRRTPVAVSTITAAEIQSKSSGNVELTEIAKATPSVYVANQSGGYGDSEVFTRGFDQTNTAFLLNGQPINGMEDGKMYWSNWSGLTDVASAIQIQRGLGASKLAISSVGGTWNFIMKPTELTKGGGFGISAGNNNYQKMTAFYNTGMINNKFGVSVLLSQWSGDGWARGTRGQGQTYFISAGFKPSEKHNINFLITGAPQWHDQNFNKSISSYEFDGEIDPRFNNNWGIYKGDYFTERRNFYHKPVANLNWDFAINEKSRLSTVLYASWGRGGGTGGLGSGRIRTESNLINFDAIEAAKAVDPEVTYIRRASMNLHSWYGSVIKYERDLSSNLNFSIGGDLRSYTGDHFRQVANLIGSDSYEQRSSARFPNGTSASTEYSPDPWAALSDIAPVGDRIAYNNAETIQYGGLFSQLEYSKNSISAYVQGSISNQSHIRFEKFYASEAEEDSEKVSNSGYNIKGGLSYALNDNHGVFVNAGLYSRQPFHDVVFVGNSNQVSAGAENEKVVGMELGYKLSGARLAANVNLYRTAWNNRVETQYFRDGDVATLNGTDYNIVGEGFINTKKDQLHQGVELDFSYKVSDAFKIKGFGSVGNWASNGDAVATLFDDNINLVDTEILSGENSIDGQKVGGAAQTSFGAGAKYRITDNFHTELNYIHYANLYARVSSGELKLPAYGVADLNVGYTVPFSNGNVLKINGNIYNLLDKLYISQANSSNEASTDASENWNGINKSNRVRFGKTRTWNISMKYSF